MYPYIAIFLAFILPVLYLGGCGWRAGGFVDLIFSPCPVDTYWFSFKLPTILN